MRSSRVELDSRPNKRVYEITDAGREALEQWLHAPSRGTRLKDEFFLKLVLASRMEAADPIALIDEQRIRYLEALRDLRDLQVTTDDPVSALLAEGAELHVEADLKWLDLFEEQWSEERRS